METTPERLAAWGRRTLSRPRGAVSSREPNRGRMPTAPAATAGAAEYAAGSGPTYGRPFIAHAYWKTPGTYGVVAPHRTHAALPPPGPRRSSWVWMTRKPLVRWSAATSSSCRPPELPLRRKPRRVAPSDRGSRVGGRVPAVGVSSVWQGQRSTHLVIAGCFRFANAESEWLARYLPAGYPRLDPGRHSPQWFLKSTLPVVETEMFRICWALWFGRRIGCGSALVHALRTRIQPAGPPHLLGPPRAEPSWRRGLGGDPRPQGVDEEHFRQPIHDHRSASRF